VEFSKRFAAFISTSGIAEHTTQYPCRRDGLRLGLKPVVASIRLFRLQLAYDPANTRFGTAATARWCSRSIESGYSRLTARRIKEASTPVHFNDLYPISIINGSS